MLWRTLRTGPFPWIIGGLALLLAWAFFWLAGSAVVIDETSGVQEAVVTDGGSREQKLLRIWGGHYYAIPAMEGSIEVRCPHGVRKQAGYVTGSLHTTVRVVGSEPCQQVTD